MYNFEKFLTEDKIKNLQNAWSESNIPLNNTNYNKFKIKTSTKEQRSFREMSLEKLIAVIAEDFEEAKKNDYKLFRSGTNNDLNTYFKYLKKDLLANFPFTKIDALIAKKCKEKWPEWWRNFEGVDESKRNNWTRTTLAYTEENMLTVRYLRLRSLAKIAHTIDTIQNQDLKKHGININQSGKIADNSSLAFGTNKALSAYLGQWIIRKFPFKDYPFYSSEIDAQKQQNIIYEHYTPMSFFRDLIWAKDFTERESFVFSENTKVFSVEEWLSIFWHCYRIVNILKKEEDYEKLTAQGWRSRRPYNAYELCEITVKNKPLWKKMHAIAELQEIDKLYHKGKLFNL
jgi:hypothetical protein